MMPGNWKMNNTIAEAVVLAQEISNRMERDWLGAAWTWPSARRSWISSR